MGFVEIDKAFVNAVAEIGRDFLADNLHDASRELSVQLIIAGEYGNLLVGKLLGKLEIGRSGLDAQPFCLVAARHDAAVVV